MMNHADDLLRKMMKMKVEELESRVENLERLVHEQGQQIGMMNYQMAELNAIRMELRRGIRG